MTTTRFRLNPALDVALWSALSADEQGHIRRLTGQEAVPGIVRPRPGAGGTIKAIDDRTVELLLSLRAPGPIVDCGPAAAIPRSITCLVLDGLLEVESETSFVSGPAALARLGVTGAAAEPVDRVSLLSRQALEYAEGLPITDARGLAGRLYAFNTVPLSQRWRATLADARAVGEWLELDHRGANAAALCDGDYQEVDHPQWFAWTRRDFTAGQALPDAGFKLYVSPRPEDLPEVIKRAVAEAVSSRVLSMKVGRTSQNVLRPDKCVLYLEDEGSLQELAARLSRGLAGFRAQGVPFTRALTGDGMLSWGSDPPRSLCLTGWAQAESWRAWIANRLAISILQAKADGRGDVQPWRFAMAKLSVEGVDPQCWSARAGLWREEAGQHG
jgi:hypothetical protein